VDPFDPDKLIGSWKIVSAQGRFVDSDEVVDLLGPNPLGYCTFDGNGRWMVVTSASRLPVITTDAERAEWLGHGFVAFTGQYRVDADIIHTRIDVAWNPAFVGVEIPRQMQLTGDQLTVIQPEWEHPFFPGRKMVGVVLWQRERA
jgi:hypothetical protein